MVWFLIEITDWIEFLENLFNWVNCPIGRPSKVNLFVITYELESQLVQFTAKKFSPLVAKVITNRNRMQDNALLDHNRCVLQCLPNSGEHSLNPLYNVNSMMSRLST